MTKDEALRMALEALETELCIDWTNNDEFNESAEKMHEAITAIKEALAQPKQDKERCVGCEACIDTACGRDECPKGWPKAAQPEHEPVAKYTGETWCGSVVSLYEDIPLDTLLYTNPPQRKPLTDEEIMDIAMNKPFDSAIGFARAIEAKLKEKNT